MLTKGNQRTLSAEQNAHLEQQTNELEEKISEMTRSIDEEEIKQKVTKIVTTIKVNFEDLFKKKQLNNFVIDLIAKIIVNMGNTAHAAAMANQPEPEAQTAPTPSEASNPPPKTEPEEPGIIKMTLEELKQWDDKSKKQKKELEDLQVVNQKQETEISLRDNTIKKLGTENKKLKDSMTNLETQVKDLRNEVNELGKIKERLEYEVKDVEGKKLTMASDYTSYQEEVKQLRKQVSQNFELERTHHELLESNESLKKRISEMEDKLAQKTLEGMESKKLIQEKMELLQKMKSLESNISELNRSEERFEHSKNAWKNERLRLEEEMNKKGKEVASVKIMLEGRDEQERKRSGFCENYA
eukprot:TRINITY_DN2610_c0_g2_i1.p1 TRINITY_DN2610_c0_g2~~TRINITY_DN2610_c0_g2_i1.p1  ORF type:complete len:356 (-),score=68.80 TRINITY_DN2610_c0_g2_i1:334-1401(-)